MSMTPVNLRPDERTLRQFGWITLVVMSSLAALIYWRKSFLFWDFLDQASTVAAILLGIGVASAVVSLIYPRANWPLFLLLTVVTFPIGFVVSHILLAIVYFGVVTPTGLVARLLGFDPLKRKLEPDRQSYWNERPEPPPASRYFRQS